MAQREKPIATRSTTRSTSRSPTVHPDHSSMEEQRKDSLEETEKTSRLTSATRPSTQQISTIPVVSPSVSVVSTMIAIPDITVTGNTSHRTASVAVADQADRGQPLSAPLPTSPCGASTVGVCLICQDMVRDITEDGGILCDECKSAIMQ